MTRPLPFFESVRQDIQASFLPEAKQRTGLRRLVHSVSIVLLASGFHLSFLYRVSHSLRFYLGFPGKVIASAIYWFERHYYHCEISPTARLAGGITFPHPSGITIGGQVKIGHGSWVYQHATIGGGARTVGDPDIGNGARIYPGATIAGPVRIGHRSVVGANAVVTQSAPDGSVIAAPSSRILTARPSPIPKP